MQSEKMIVFRNSKIRRIWHEEEWWFSVIDIIDALTESENPAIYWRVLKHREPQLVTICNGLKLPAADGKMRLTDCVHTENAFRLIQSIPSKNAEPFKRWLARVGYQRIREIENPELAEKRIHETYRKKGYSDEWIAKRVRGMEVRDQLVNEWDRRGVKAGSEYSILTSEISKAAFGMTPTEYKAFKGLSKEALRDHMDGMELILSMLGEATTTRIHRKRDSLMFEELRKDAKDGGGVAGITRSTIEKKLGEKVISSENFLTNPESKERGKKLNEKLDE